MPQWSLQMRPTMVTAKPANGMARDGGSFTLSGGGWASPFWSAFEDVTMMEQSVQHRGDGGAVTQ